MKVCVCATNGELQQEENYPTVPEEAPEGQLHLSPRDPRPSMSFKVSRLDGLLQQYEDSEQHERSHRREVLTARTRLPARYRMHDSRKQERQQHDYRSPGHGVFPEAQTLFRDENGVYGEGLPHRFVPEVAIPPPQGVSLSDVSEKRWPVLERGVEDPHCNERRNSVRTTDRECRSAIGIEGD